MLLRLIRGLVGRKAPHNPPGDAGKATSVRIRQFGDWWLPENDPLFEMVAARAPIRNGRHVWELAHIDRCIAAVPRRRRAIDVGAHVGFWSWVLAGIFDQVEAFEPHPLMQACFRRNVTAPNVRLHPMAVGARAGKGAMVYGAGNSGQSHILPNGAGNTDIRALDELGFSGVDFIKMDVEGFEPFVIEGAVELVRRERPIIFMEQNSTSLRYGQRPREAVLMLEEMGAAVLAEMAGHNVLLGWRD